MTGHFGKRSNKNIHFFMSLLSFFCPFIFLDIEKTHTHTIFDSHIQRNTYNLTGTHTHTHTVYEFFFHTQTTACINTLLSFSISLVTITCANRQACICTLTFFAILTYTYTHLNAAGESSPPSGWQSGWQDSRTAPRLAKNMTIVQRLALIRPCFAQCIVGCFKYPTHFEWQR